MAMSSMLPKFLEAEKRKRGSFGIAPVAAALPQTLKSKQLF